VLCWCCRQQWELWESQLNAGLNFSHKCCGGNLYGIVVVTAVGAVGVPENAGLKFVVLHKCCGGNLCGVC
jgi:hypothetical protein